MRSGQLSVCAVLLSLCMGCGPLRVGTTEKGREMDAALRQALQSSEQPAYVARDGEGARLWKLTRQFYDRREFAPAWIENASPRPQMDALISAIHAADREGLDPELYSAGLLDEQKKQAS